MSIQVTRKSGVSDVSARMSWGCYENATRKLLSWNLIFMQPRRDRKSARPTYNPAATPTLAVLRRCRWPRPRYAARLVALVRSWRRDNKNVYYHGCQSMLNPNPHHNLDLVLYDLDSQSEATAHTRRNIRVQRSVGSKDCGNKRTNEPTDASDCLTLTLTRSVVSVI